MSVMASLITGIFTVYSGEDQRKHQSSAWPAFVRGTTGGRWIPLTEACHAEMFPFGDVIMHTPRNTNINHKVSDNCEAHICPLIIVDRLKLFLWVKHPTFPSSPRPFSVKTFRVITPFPVTETGNAVQLWPTSVLHTSIKRQYRFKI